MTETPPAPTLGWATITAYFRVLDFGRTPDTKLGWAVRFSAVLLTIVLLWQRLNAATGPMLLAKPLPPVEKGYRPLLPDPGLGITIDEDKLKSQVGEPRPYLTRFDGDDGSVVDW